MKPGEESTEAESTEVEVEDSEWVPDEDGSEDNDCEMDDEWEEEQDDMTELEEEVEEQEQYIDWDIVDAEDKKDYEVDGEDDEDYEPEEVEEEQEQYKWDIVDAKEEKDYEAYGEDDEDYEQEDEDEEDADDDYNKDHDEDLDEDLPLKKRRCLHRDVVHETTAETHEPPWDNKGSNGKDTMDKAGSSDEGSHEDSFDTEGTQDLEVVYVVRL